MPPYLNHNANTKSFLVQNNWLKYWLIFILSIQIISSAFEKLSSLKQLDEIMVDILNEKENCFATEGNLSFFFIRLE